MDKSLTGRLVALSAVLLLLCCTGCASLKDIRNVSLRSFTVKSLNINGFDSADIIFEAAVYNPAKNIDISLLEGTAYKSGKPIGSFSMEPFSVEGRTEGTVTAGCTVRLAPGLSLTDIMSMASDFNISEYTVDITVRGRIGKSPKKKFMLKDVPAEYIIKDF